MKLQEHNEKESGKTNKVIRISLGKRGKERKGARKMFKETMG